LDDAEQMKSKRSRIPMSHFGAKETSTGSNPMSASDPKRTSVGGGLLPVKQLEISGATPV